MSSLLQLSSEMLLVGDDKGRVWIYRCGNLITVKTVFTSPVVSLHRSSEVVMVATYSTIVIWSRRNILEIIANTNIEDMQVSFEITEYNSPADRQHCMPMYDSTLVFKYILASLADCKFYFFDNSGLTSFKTCLLKSLYLCLLLSDKRPKTSMLQNWFLPSKTKVLKQQKLELFSLQFYRELCVQFPLRCHSYVD